jgi:hypothetical protein
MFKLGCTLALILIYSPNLFAVDKPHKVRADRPMPVPNFVVENPDPEVTLPVRISGNSPVYPISLLLTGIKGQATISFIIGIGGIPKNFEVIKTNNKKFADHAGIERNCSNRNTS